MKMCLKLQFKLFLDMKVSQVLLQFPSQSKGRRAAQGKGSSVGAAVGQGRKIGDAVVHHK